MKTKFIYTLLTFSLCAASLRADDVVTVFSGKDGRGRARLTGEILDYQGSGLLIRLASGREESVPTERIVSLETPLNSKHTEADDMMRQAKFAEAIPLYREAANGEKRPWVTRRIIASSVQCYLQLQQIDRAGELFLGLVRKDPQTPHLEVIPLSWSRIDPNTTLQQKATTWLKDESPAAVLMGASWLVSLGDRGAAVKALQKLADDKDPRIASLANAQLWRVRLVQVTSEDLARWQAQIEKMPQNLRAGPYFTVGLALSRLDQSEAAALAFLRVPVQFPAQHSLANEALLAAGKELEKLSQPEGAATLYREILATRMDSPQTADAETRLKKLGTQGGRSE